MNKSELLIFKPNYIEAVLNAAVRRQSLSSLIGKEGVKQEAALFDKIMENWENLTSMQVIDGVAIIPIRGTVTPDDPFAAYYGEISLVNFTANFQAALADTKVKSILLNIFSPGGYVYGVEAAANLVYAARGQKPITAYTDSLIASAAYWLASAADKIVVGSETAEVGSIGVYAVHFDYTEALAAEGIKVTEITTGEFKGLGSPYAALSAEDKKLLQADSNYVYTRFVNTVARNRGMAVEAVLKSANGLTFYGSEAIKLGLADSINTFQEVLAMTTKVESPTAEDEEAKRKQKEEAENADKAQLQARNSELEAQLAAYKLTEETQAKEKLTAEVNVAVKAAFGRDATSDEIELFTKLDEAGRKVYKAGLEETAANRDKVVQASGLTTEVATSGVEEKNSPDQNPLVLAARALGFAS